MKARAYQTECVSKLLEYINKNPGKHPVLALPTGSGKSYIIALIIQMLLEKRKDVRILILTHSKEIITQNSAEIEAILGNKIAVYSAGIGRKEIGKITIASIQSAHRKWPDFENFHYAIIDECHAISNDEFSTYRKLLGQMKKARYIGLTATPYRLGTGLIYGQENTLFDDLAYDLTSMDNFNKLVEDGYLCKLRTKPSKNEFDADSDSIRTVAGDFDLKQLSIAYDRDALTNSCVDELIREGKNYKKWLIFAIDIDHAEHIAETLIRKGVKATVVHSQMELDRDVIISKFKVGEYRAIVNVNVLTTGFNDPEIDLIAMMRPTKSPVLHVQAIGRGLRVAPGKKHCLILDFAGNTDRLGPINDVRVVKKSKSKEGGDPITKRCPDCDAIHHPTVKVCEWCGHKFKFKVGLEMKASSTEVVAAQKQHWFRVEKVLYSKHEKVNRPPSLKVTYLCGIRSFKEFVHPEHPGYPGHRGLHWLKFRGSAAKTVDEALKSSFKEPARIRIDTSGKYPVVVDYSF